MAIVQAGKQFDVDDLQRQAGNLAAAIRGTVQNGGNFKIQLETWSDADLITLGLEQAEIDAIKGFFIGDLPAIQQALESSVWIKKLLGLGA